MADVFRQPLFTRIERRGSPPAFLFPNLLITTLAIQPVRPFRQTNWPNPIPRRPIPQDMTVSGRLPSSIPVAPPIANVFRQPLITKIPERRYPTLFSSPNLLLNTLRVTAPATRPFYQRNWEVPLGHKRARMVEYETSFCGFMPPPPTNPPFSQKDWPVPRGWKRLAAQQSIPNQNRVLLRLLATPEAFPPGRQRDWQLPPIRKRDLRVTHFRNSYNPLPPVEPPLDIPRNQYDWPIPLRPEWMQGQSIETVTYTATPDELLLHLQIVWQNPIPRRAAQQPEQFVNVLIRNLPAIPAERPLSQQDWPNPIPRRAALQPELPQSLLGTLLVLPDAPIPPGSQRDWPLPVYRLRFDPFFAFGGAPTPNEPLPPAEEIEVPEVPVTVTIINRRGGRAILAPKKAGETVRVPFDFISWLSVGETFLTKEVEIEVYSGVDASAANMVSGAASSSGSVVTQLIRNGVVGVIYKVTCRVTTSLGQLLELTGFLVIEDDLP
jgi:hypothetical protein